MCAYAMAKNVQACVLEVKQCILAITLFRYTLFCFEMICQGIVLGLHAKNQLCVHVCATAKSVSMLVLEAKQYIVSIKLFLNLLFRDNACMHARNQHVGLTHGRSFIVQLQFFI